MATNDNTLSYLDNYCERAGETGLLAEPLNAVTNLFFIFYALRIAHLLYRMPNRTFRHCWDIWLLTIILAIIGVGSGLWHTYATRWSVLMDVIPIALFIHFYLVFFLRRAFNFGRIKTLLGWLAFIGLTTLFELFASPDMLNGTIMYVPTYVTLVVIALACYRYNRVIAPHIWIVIAIWTASLLFRTIDNSICDSFPYGTHFLWHILNSIVLYRLLKILVAHQQPVRTA